MGVSHGSPSGHPFIKCEDEKNVKKEFIYDVAVNNNALREMLCRGKYCY